jgi:hypothetical protein
VFDAVNCVFSSSSVNQLQVTHTAAGSNRLAAFCIGEGRTTTFTVTSAKYNTVDATFVDESIQSSDDWQVELWRLVAPGTGASVTAEVNLSAATTNWGFCVLTYKDVDQTSPLGTTAKTIGVGDASLDVSSASGDTVIDCLVSSGGAATVGAGQTQRIQSTFSSEGRLLGSEEAGAATTTMSWTGTSRFATLGVGLRAVGSAPPNVRRRILNSKLADPFFWQEHLYPGLPAGEFVALLRHGVSEHGFSGLEGGHR